MSAENAETVRGVRTPVTVSSEPRGRSVDERLLVRFPMLARALASVWSWLPPRSRPRRALTTRSVRQAAEAANRRDFDFLLLRFDPAIEFQLAESLAGRFVVPDLLGVHRGHEGYRRMWRGMIEAFEDLTLEPEEVIDFGGRALVAGRVTGHGSHSGIRIDEPLFQVFTMRRGLVIRQKDFVDRDEALEAAGLRE